MDKVAKLVLVVQDLPIKGGEIRKLISFDVFYFKDADQKKLYDETFKKFTEEKNEKKQVELQKQLTAPTESVSAQMLYEDNKELKHLLNDLVLQAIELKEKKNGKSA